MLVGVGFEGYDIENDVYSGMDSLMVHWVYILYSESANRFYIGQTNDVAARLERHNNGYEKYTSPYKPWSLTLCLSKPSRGDAMILERKLKNLNTEDLKKFIEKYR